MQIYDFTIPVNTQRQLDAPGTYFYYYSGSAGGADQTITLRGVSSGLRIVLKSGQSMRLPKGQAPETSWYIGNYANAATIVGTVIVGNGEIQDNRIQGSVEIVDGGKNRTFTQNAFMIPIACNALAANYAQVQLFNPAASGKNIIFEGFTASSGVANSIYGGFQTAAMANSAAIGSGQNKFMNGAGSVALRKWQNNAALGIAAPMIVTYLQAQNPYTFKFIEPIIITQNSGFGFSNTVLNVDLSINFEYYEENA